MATVYLHIGTMKTGTSALQRFLYENREYLKSRGYIYPEKLEGMPVNYFFRNGHFLVYDLEKRKGSQKAVDEGVDKQKIIQAGYQRLEELAKGDEDIILSDESIWHFSAQDPDFWTELRERLGAMGCGLKVIVYLRRQDAFTESLYSHSIKSNHRVARSFDGYINRGTMDSFVLDYYGNIRNIAERIGKENLIIRTYEKERFIKNKNGIFDDFLGILGLTLDENYKLQKTAKNSGLEGNYLEFKRVINGLPEYRECANFMSRPLVLASAVSVDGKIRKKEGFFTPEGRKEYMEQFEEGNSRLAREYLNREDGVLFYGTSEDIPVWRLDRENMWKDLVIAMTEVFCAQEKRIQALEREMDGLQETYRDVWFQRAYRKVKNHFRKE